MHDFGKLVYMDLQKSGSTYVSQFLNETCTLPMVREVKHGRIGRRDYDPEAFYFITVRHPLKQYRSLFRYGLDGRGALFNRLKASGHAGLYENSQSGFNTWMAFLLDPRNAKYLGESFKYTSRLSDIGFMTHRFLMLALPAPLSTLVRLRLQANGVTKRLGLSRYSDPKGLLDDAQMIELVIRQESLKDGLRHLAQVLKPEYFDQAKVAEFLGDAPLINASESGKDLAMDVDPDVMALLRRKESILFDFYPDASELSATN